MNRVKLILIAIISKQLSSTHSKLRIMVCNRYIKIPQFTMFPYTILKTEIGSNLITYQDEENNHYIPSKEMQKKLLPYYIKYLSQNPFLSQETNTCCEKCSNLLVPDCKLTYLTKPIKKLSILFLEYEDDENVPLLLVKEEDEFDCLVNIFANSHMFHFKEKNDIHYKSFHSAIQPIPFKDIKININPKFFLC